MKVGVHTGQGILDLDAAAEHLDKKVPTTGEQLYYEAEMILVIGKEAKDVSREEALDYVFGYSVGNDLSVRGLQFKSGRQWLLGKIPDKFAPIGPYLGISADCDITGNYRNL